MSLLKMNYNEFGIYENSYNLIINELQKVPEIEKAVIFGSRSIGNYKKGSDIDIALFGEKLTFDILSKIHNILNEEIPIPYFVDLVLFEKVKNDDLKKHIDEFGKIIYKK